MITRIYCFLIAGLNLLVGFNAGFNTQGLFSRCFADGQFSSVNQYYASQWMGLFLALAAVNLLAGFQKDRKIHRIAIVADVIAAVVMGGNFWRAYGNNWMTYVDQCVLEETISQIFIGTVSIFIVTWEWFLADFLQKRKAS